MVITAATVAATQRNKRESSGESSECNKVSTSFFVFEVVKISGILSSKEESLGYLIDFNPKGYPVCSHKNSPVQLLFYNYKNDSEYCFSNIWEHMRNLDKKYNFREVLVNIEDMDLDKKATLVHSRIGITTYKQFKKWYNGEKFKYAKGHTLLKSILGCTEEGRKV